VRIRPLYTLFDSDVREGGPVKLHDSFILELYLLFDMTSASVDQLARGFDIDQDEVKRFFITPHSGSPSTMMSWRRGLRLVEADRPAIARITKSAAVRLGSALEHGLNYVEHTKGVFAALKAALKANDHTYAPGLTDMDDVKNTIRFYKTAADDVKALLGRAEWPAVEEPEATVEEGDDVEDGPCEVIETHAPEPDDGVVIEDDETEEVQEPDPEPPPLVDNAFARRYAASRAWHYEAH
jgi:hypothetical protein